MGLPGCPRWAPGGRPPAGGRGVRGAPGGLGLTLGGPPLRTPEGTLSSPGSGAPSFPEGRVLLGARLPTGAESCLPPALPRLRPFPGKKGLGDETALPPEPGQGAPCHQSGRALGRDGEAGHRVWLLSDASGGLEAWSVCLGRRGGSHYGVLRRDGNMEVSHAAVTDLPSSICGLRTPWRGGGLESRRTLLSSGAADRPGAD